MSEKKRSIGGIAIVSILIVILCTGLGFILSGAFSYLRPQAYMARTVVQVAGIPYGGTAVIEVIAHR